METLIDILFWPAVVFWAWFLWQPLKAFLFGIRDEGKRGD